MNSEELNNICRTCMCSEANKLQSLYSWMPKANQKRVADILQECVPGILVCTINFELPATICENCIQELKRVETFQQMCLKSQKEISLQLERTLLKPIEVGAKADDPLYHATVKIEVPSECDEFLIKLEPSYSEEENNEKCSAISRDKLTHDEHSSHSYDLNPNVSESSSDTDDETIPLSSLVRSAFSKKENIETPEVTKRKRKKKCCLDDSNTEDTIKEIECKHCGEKFTNSYKYGKHRKLAHPDAKKGRKKVNIIKTCNFCGKTFDNNSVYNVHLKKHSDKKEFLCSECGKSFKLKASLTGHMLVHKGEKTFQCDKCPRKFDTSSRMLAHRAIHKTTRPHLCNECGKGFKMKNELNTHKRIHTGEKPFKCDYCVMRFGRSYHKARHMLTHTGLKPHKCKYCERAFAQHNDLIKHLRSHLGDNVYQCELCPQAFPLARDLREHFALHINDDDETKEHNLIALKEKESQRKILLVPIS